MKRKIYSRLLFLLLMTTMGGCTTLPGAPPLAVKIPSDCENNAVPVPYPRIVKGEDLGVRSAKQAAALGQANGRLDAVRQCEAKVREAFDKP
jgi:hypothetical protein